MKNVKYSSIFKCEIEDYINIKINNGYQIQSFSYLAVFDNFLVANDYNERRITKDIIDKWAIQKPTENKNTRYSRVIQIKQFCEYLVSIGIDAWIPKFNFELSKPRPYVLTYAELKLLFNGIDNYFNERSNGVYHYKYMIPVLFRLLYTTGLRNNEACTLKIDSISSKDKFVIINGAKNQKDRIVYLSDDMYDLLIKYVNSISGYSKYGWLFPANDPINHINKTLVDKYFHKVVIKCGLGNVDYHPVPHSLRHTYVVHRVDKWLKEGKQIDDLMPYLSKQLGHSHINETYYYYHMLESSFDVINNTTRNLYPEVSYEK